MLLENNGVKKGVKVVKFGGSSLADAGQFRKVAKIILADKERRYVIPSAPGKRFSSDTKVTDMLYDCYDLGGSGRGFSASLGDIKRRYEEIIEGLGLELSLDDEFKAIEQAFRHKAGRDYAASRGEYLNGIILANYLGYEFLDPAGYILFDEKGSFDFDKTNEILGKKLASMKNCVIPGFYGSMPNDTIKTFSRGGSDITGSIVARAVGADIYENWTDVSGFLLTDPRIIVNPEPITTITYRELRELCYMGAMVLHEDAIFPVRTAGIPINIRNTNDPAAPGTMIVSSCQEVDSKYTITGIAGKKGFTSINIEKDMMNSQMGFGVQVLELLRDMDISFEHMPSGIDTMSLIVRNSALEGREEELLQSIRENLQPDSLEVEHNLALVAVVGRGMRQVRGTAARVFAALSHARVNVKMIDQGSSELNIIVGISDEDFETAIKAIYDIFVTTNL